jgi:hypothetical protein
MDKRSYALRKLYAEYCKPNGYSLSWQIRRVREGTYFSVIAFVSKDLIVLVRKRDFALEVCEITEGDDKATFTLRTACILKLPSLHPSTRVRFHSRNRTPFASNFSTPALHSNRLPFRSSPADAILGFEISLRRHGRRPGSELRRLAFWVHHRALRKYAAETARPSHIPLKLEPRSSPQGIRGLVSRLVNRISDTFTTPPVLHWSQWGPQSTRWRECSDDLRDRQTLAGMRCAVVHQGSLTLMDFSPGRLAMLRAQNSPENTDLKVVEAPTDISAGRCFVRDFNSKLPYCERTKEEIKNRVLMDDEWILQIEVRFHFWHWSCYDSLGLFLITGRGSVWLGRLSRFPQHLTDRQPLRSIKSNHSLMLLLLRQRVLYAITLQRLFHAETPSRCCSLILKILHVFAFHEFQASRVYVFSSDIAFFFLL